MPQCYFLTVCASSAIDQTSNNVSLFNVVEQINVHPRAGHPPNGLLPLEIHAYWRLMSGEQGQPFETRFVLVAESGLETSSTTFRHRPLTSRFRTRTMGIPFPPVFGEYVLRVDFRSNEEDSWQRAQPEWPFSIRLAETAPATTH
ncbi:MAG TPA: hypothetical protein VHM70_31880 [Polyangiaceae bacterium]|nr:hypothetical protein [Polyangiaceae bacterium]